MSKTPRTPNFIETDITNLLPLKKLDETLKYILQANNPPFRTDSEIQKEVGFEADSKDLFEILHKLEKDGYIIKEIRASNQIAEYWSTFDGRFFMTETKGYLEQIQDEYQNRKTAEQEKELIRNQITTAIASGNASIETNDQIKKATWVIAIATVINVIVAALPFFKNNDAILLTLQQSVQKNNQLKAETFKYQKEIDSLLTKAVKDSFYRK